MSALRGCRAVVVAEAVPAAAIVAVVVIVVVVVEVAVLGRLTFAMSLKAAGGVSRVPTSPTSLLNNTPTQLTLEQPGLAPDRQWSGGQ